MNRRGGTDKSDCRCRMRGELGGTGGRLGPPVFTRTGDVTMIRSPKPLRSLAVRCGVKLRGEVKVSGTFDGLFPANLARNGS